VGIDVITPQEQANRAKAWQQVFEHALDQYLHRVPTDGFNRLRRGRRTPLALDMDDLTVLTELCQFVIDTVEKEEHDARLRDLS
jgi:hypothetical protein